MWHLCCQSNGTSCNYIGEWNTWRCNSATITCPETSALLNVDADNLSSTASHIHRAMRLVSTVMDPNQSDDWRRYWRQTHTYRHTPLEECRKRVVPPI